MKKTVKPSHLLLATVTFAVFGLTACEKESEMDTIKDAQMCLNSAAPAGAQACVSKLASNTSPQANQLKCAAYFIQENLGSPTGLIEAIDASNTDTSCASCSGSMAIISQLKFSSSGVPATDIANADAAFSVCSASGVGIYTQLASMVNIATVTGAALGANADANDYATAIAAVDASTLGNIVIETYESSCDSNSSSDSDESELQKYCTELSGAVAEATPADVGACIKYKLTGQNYPGLPCPAN
ncbi:hypothetical protein [Pseudobdellovibrio sp. HCB154]|uniref:hypothetical protein n=1 Tax=Pseudobdellovibrio sp. HCB154 TaxID=3386277 RepID=UPI003916FEDF